MMIWILIIDDDVDNRELLAELLASSDYAARSCGSAGEAAELLSENGRPALVISDVRLPDMHGPTFVAEMRSRPGFEDTPVVFVTGSSPDRIGAKGDPVLVKPFDPSVLVDLVARYCGSQPAPAVWSA